MQVDWRASPTRQRLNRLFLFLPWGGSCTIVNFHEMINDNDNADTLYAVAYVHYTTYSRQQTISTRHMLKTPGGTVPRASNTHRGKLPFNSSHMRLYTLSMMYAKYERTCQYLGISYSLTYQRKGPDILIFPSTSMFSVGPVLFLARSQFINDVKHYRSEDTPSRIGKRFSFVRSRVATTRYS